MMACPYGIPRYDWDQAVPYVRKCILCYDRIQSGRQPACTESCPAKATVFGDRDQLVAEAHRRIGESPNLYVNRVWGETDVGGTSVLYISNVDLSFLNQGQAPGATPLPERTAAAMNAVPFAFTGMLAVMGGVHWIVERRKKLQMEESRGKEESNG
jgi:formate dehydrogenase iron-sulfur subunit